MRLKQRNRNQAQPMSSQPASRRPLEVFSGWQPKRLPNMPLPPDPDLPAAYDDRDLRAWQALNKGEATAEQQRRCLEHLWYMTGHNGRAYVRGDAMASNYANGKRAVAIEIGVMISMRPSGPSETEQGT